MVDSLKLIIKKNNLNLLFIFKNYFSLISLIGFLLLGWILVIAFVPIYFGGAQNMVIQIYMLLILGVLSYQWSNSTLKNNEVISGVGRTKHYLSLLLTIFIIGNLSSFILLFGDVLLDKIGILSRYWAWDASKYHDRIYYLYFENVQWYLVFYIFQLNILLTFSVYFFANRFFSNKRSYYIFLMFLAIFLILFGGTLNNYFQKTLYYNPGYDLNKNINLGFILDSSAILPTDIFLPTSLFFPFYNINQFYNTIVLQMLSDQHWLTHTKILLSDFKSYTPFLLDFNNPDHWQWSLVIIMPYVHILIFLILGVLSSEIKKFTK